MKVLVLTILALLTSSLFATPYDGVYSIRESDLLDQIAEQYERSRKGMMASDLIVPQFSNAYLSIEGNTNISIEEREDGSIVLFKRNLIKKDWQVYIGYQDDQGYKFVNVFNRTKDFFLSEDGVSIESEEIYIEFDDSGIGRYSHTLVLSGELFFTGVAVPEDGRAEIVVAEPMTRIGAVN